MSRIYQSRQSLFLVKKNLITKKNWNVEGAVEQKYQTDEVNLYSESFKSNSAISNPGVIKVDNIRMYTSNPAIFMLLIKIICQQ